MFEVSHQPNTTFKPQLYGLNELNSTISFVQLKDKSYTVYTKEQNNIFTQSESGTLDKSVQDIMAVPHNGIVYITKEGELYSVIDKQAKILYASQEKSFIVPYKLDISNDGQIYFTDIGNNDIYAIKNNATKILFTKQWLEDALGANLDQSVLTGLTINGTSKDGSLMAIFDSSVGNVNLANGAMKSQAEYQISPIILIATLLAYSLAIFGGILAVMCIFAFGKDIIAMLTRTRTGKTILIAAGVLAILAFISFNLLIQIREMMVDTKLNELSRIASNVAAIVDPKDISEVNYPTDYESPAIKRIREATAKILPRSGMGAAANSQIYCNYTKINQDKAYSFFFQDDSIGVYYPLYYEEAESLKQIYLTKEPQLDGVISGATGTYVYVKTPILRQETVI